MVDLVLSLDNIGAARDRRRSKNDPDPVAASVIAEMAGVDGVAVHLRADRKHVQERDVRLLRELVKTRLHLALVPTTDAVKFAYAVKPDVVTLVPERREEISSSIGLDVILNQAQLKKTIRALKEVGVHVDILVDPDADQVRASQAAEADGVILNSRLYADSGRAREAQDELDKIETSARVARKHKMRVTVGHGLDYSNIGPIARMAEVDAVEIGHAVVARALFSGLDTAVRQMLDVLREARR